MIIIEYLIIMSLPKMDYSQMIIHTQYLSMKMYLVVEVLSMTMMKKFITNSVEIKIVGYERKTTQASCKNPELKLI